MEGTVKGLGVIRSEEYEMLYLLLIYSSRKVISCNEEGMVYLFDWDDSECSNTVYKLF